MPRRREIPKRELPADPVYGSTLVSKFINTVMSDGKKSTAERILYKSFDIIKERTGDDPLKVFKKALDNVKPSLEVKARRVGGSNYQVPVEVNPNRRLSLSIRWLVSYARQRGDGPTHVGQVETLGELVELVAPARTEVDRADRRADLVGERSREAIGAPPEGERSREPGRGTRGQQIEELRDLGVDGRAPATVGPQPSTERETQPWLAPSVRERIGGGRRPMEPSQRPVVDRDAQTGSEAGHGRDHEGRDGRGDHCTSSSRRIHRNASPSRAKPSPIATMPAGVRSAPSISLRDVSHRNAKNPNGNTPRIVPDRRAWAVSARTSLAPARRSRNVSATSSSTEGRSPPLRRCSVRTPASRRASPVSTSAAHPSRA